MYKPTRITKSTATLIDNLFTNNLSKTEHLNGILFNDISDHLPIFTITGHELHIQNDLKLMTTQLGKLQINL